ncbi:hypothetical protein OC835_007732 [Tilletia horrida]|nr:hypothetical protein OC835_007732 [Tilletia horrida]
MVRTRPEVIHAELVRREDFDEDHHVIDRMYGSIDGALGEAIDGALGELIGTEYNPSFTEWLCREAEALAAGIDEDGADVDGAAPEGAASESSAASSRPPPGARPEHTFSKGSRARLHAPSPSPNRRPHVDEPPVGSRQPLVLDYGLSGTDAGEDSAVPAATDDFPSPAPTPTSGPDVGEDSTAHEATGGFPSPAPTPVSGLDVGELSSAAPLKAAFADSTAQIRPPQEAFPSDMLIAALTTLSSSINNASVAIGTAAASIQTTGASIEAAAASIQRSAASLSSIISLQKDDVAFECDLDGSRGDDVRAVTKLPQIIPTIAERLPSFFYGLAQGIASPSFLGTARQEQIVSDVRKGLMKKKAGPHFDAVRERRTQALSRVTTLRQPEWSNTPVETWAKVGVLPTDFEPNGLLKLGTQPDVGETVQPIYVAGALTFAISAAHLCEHAVKAGTPNFTLSILCAAVGRYSWASNFFVTDTQMHAMHPSSTVPWHTPPTQDVFDEAVDILMSTDATIIFLQGGSNRERWGLHFAEQLSAEQDAVDLSDYLGVPAVAFSIHGKMRITIFGPHPCATLVRSDFDPKANSIQLAVDAFTVLLKCLDAIDFVVKGAWPAHRHFFTSPAWPVVASAMEEYAFQEVVRSESFRPGIDAEDALRLVPLAKRIFASGSYVPWRAKANPHKRPPAVSISPAASGSFGAASTSSMKPLAKKKKSTV